MTDLIERLRNVCTCEYTSNPASGALRTVRMCARCEAAIALEQKDAFIADYKELLSGERRVVAKRDAEIEELLQMDQVHRDQRDNWKAAAEKSKAKIARLRKLIASRDKRIAQLVAWRNEHKALQEETDD